MTRSVLIVEDHGLLADSLGFALQAEGIRHHVVMPEDPARIMQVAREVSPTVTLLDLELGQGVGSGLSLVGPLLEHSRIVLMLTGVTDPVRLAECLEAGAHGIVSKASSFEALLKAVKDAVERGSATPPHERERLLTTLRRHRAAESARRAPFERLTAREAQVLAELVEGKPADRIAEESYVSIATVRSQIRSILLKLGVNSQLAAVAMARRNHWRV